MENILIDPRMFDLQNEEEVENNIEFFRQVIQLSNSGMLSVCLYKEIMDCIVNRQVYPFPIDINKVKKRALRDAILILNDSFSRTIMNNYIEIDINVCSGTQEFSLNKKELEAQDDYFAFFSMLLSSCYSAVEISNKILVGNKDAGVKNGESVRISCGCASYNYEKEYTWVYPNQFMNESQQAFIALRELVKKKGSLFVSDPLTIKADHHNHIQKENFRCYKELAMKNKRVLSLLRHFGLYKIYFENFAEDTSFEMGTIKVISVEDGTNSEIITGWLYGCLGFRILVEMYFPQGIGHNLHAYTGGELSRSKIEQLKTALAL